MTFEGTCISSLSNRYIGAFSNRKEHTGEIIKAGEHSGERVWPFPLDDDFAEDLKSDIADILQVGQIQNPRSKIPYCFLLPCSTSFSPITSPYSYSAMSGST